jgi:HAD superfamily hydrolase (TIGR01549 family)
MVAILFDLEGTLVQSIEENPEDIKEFKEKLFRKLVMLGIQPNRLEGIHTSALMQNAAFEIVEETFTFRDATDFRLELDEFLENFEMNWAFHSKLFSDARSTLSKLGRYYNLGIVTNTSRHAADTMLLTYGIREFFGIVVTRDDVKRLKPHPEGVQFALRSLKERKFFFVGDSSYDSIAAKKAGGCSIIVKRDPAKVLKFHPDYVVASLRKIPQLINRIVIDATVPF